MSRKTVIAALLASACFALPLTVQAAEAGKNEISKEGLAALLRPIQSPNIT
ncbi:hypothetical protein [Asaia prunellae]|uniref:hypothetical protein n=1 Tax=Asaia prunellae TaxID=610245 RepID=UPI000AA9039E|nr:hypothetical protein [Asaia prunellae]